MEYKLSGKRFGEVFTTIDDEDLEKLSKHKWWANTQGKLIRVETDLFKDETIKWGRKRVSLPRYLLNIKRRDLVVDHIDGNPLNNQKSNLRVCCKISNARNRKNLNKNNKSGLRGVSWDKFRNKWVAQLMYNRKHIYLGRFDDKNEAISAVIKGRKKYFKKYGD
jgi:hypothetical protein